MGEYGENCDQIVLVDRRSGSRNLMRLLGALAKRSSKYIAARDLI